LEKRIKEALFSIDVDAMEILEGKNSFSFMKNAD
jgi:hypothetical protein